MKQGPCGPDVEPAGESAAAKRAMVAELPAAEVTERTKVDIPTQLGVSTQPEVPPAQEERVEVQQPGSPTVLMSTLRVAEPSPTTGLISGKAPATEASSIQVMSSSSEEHVDFREMNTTSVISPLLMTPVSIRTSPRERCRWMSLQRLCHREKSPPPRVFLLSHLIITLWFRQMLF